MNNCTSSTSRALKACAARFGPPTMRSPVAEAFSSRTDPGSKVLSNVHPKLHTPIASCLAIGVLAFIPMLQYAGAAIIAIAATGMIYLSYILGNIAILRARLKGWPKDDAPFKLGSWGTIVNVLALVWGIAMEINFLWPRNAAAGYQNPPISALPNVTIPSPVGDIPIFEAVLGIIIIVGAIYYFIEQRNAPETVQPTQAQNQANA